MAHYFSARKPRVYVAGKISKNDFRHDIVPRIRGWEATDGPLDCVSFTYVGPFFRACDHGCYHRPGSHGVFAPGCNGMEVTRREVFLRNQAALKSADLVLAYIEAPDCFGTLVEIVSAAENGIPVELLFAPGVDCDDFWYVQIMAGQVATQIVAREDLPRLFRQLVSEWQIR